MMPVRPDDSWAQGSDALDSYMVCVRPKCFDWAWWKFALQIHRYDDLCSFPAFTPKVELKHGSWGMPYYEEQPVDVPKELAGIAVQELSGCCYRWAWLTRDKRGVVFVGINTPLYITWQTIPNALRAAGRFIRALFTRQPVVASVDVQLERLERCWRCPRYLGAQDQCEKCTCFVSLKVLPATEQCPDTPPRWKRQTKFSDGLSLS
jgi:hypothetical protein